MRSPFGDRKVWERPLRGPGAIRLCRSVPKVTPHPGYAPSLGVQGRLRHPSPALTPKKARHRHALGAGTAALRQRLRRLLFVGLRPNGRSPRGTLARALPSLLCPVFTVCLFATLASLRCNARIRFAWYSPGPFAALRAAASVPALALHLPAG